jgi:hypothetical protein
MVRRNRSGFFGALGGFALAVSVALGGTVAGGSPAYAGTSLSVSVDVPPVYMGGQRGLPGSASITNQSDGPAADLGVTLTGILLTPACGSLSVAGVCAQGDPGVVAVTGAVGETGTGCAGMPFARMPTNDPGRVILAPALPIVLATRGTPAATCRVDLTIDVVGAPTADASPAPGTQTATSASASASEPDGTKASATGTAMSTVSAPPAADVPATSGGAGPTRRTAPGPGARLAASGGVSTFPPMTPISKRTSLIGSAPTCCRYGGGTF